MNKTNKEIEILQTCRNIAPKTKEESRLIEFAKGVLEFIARDQDCGADTIGDIVELAVELCLAVCVDTEDGELFAVTLEEYEPKETT